jgi:hypothetical protein
MSCVQRIQVLLALLWFGLSPQNAWADGGIVRAREELGAFVVTIFTASDLQQDSPADVSVMVQERDSNDAILDATVKLLFTSPAGSFAEQIEPVCGTAGMADMAPPSERFTVAATRQQASNKLLYAAPVKFDRTGNWQLQASIQRDGNVVETSCRLPVSLPPREWTGLLPWLTLPPLMVASFAANQWLRRQSLEKLQSPLIP